MTTGPARPAMTRRRVLTILAAAPGLALPAAGWRAWAETGGGAALYRWEGTALSARSSLLLHHRDGAEARRLAASALAEVERLEQIFSLYRPDSALVALNAAGRLPNPPLELVALLDRARLWSGLTEGAFDATVQPLWDLHRRHFALPGADPAGPSPEALARALTLIDHTAVRVSPEEIRLARTGMAVTLNGIAQGYIADRVADLLRAGGLEHVLIDLGEMVALGPHPDGRPWRIAPSHEPSSAAALELADKAVATSAPGALTFDPEGRFHHLFDPKQGRPAGNVASVRVVARRAADADALSTALAVGFDVASLPPAVARRGIQMAEIRYRDGRVRRLS